MSNLIVKKIKDLIKRKREMIEIFKDEELKNMYEYQISGLYSALMIIEDKKDE